MTAVIPSPLRRTAGLFTVVSVVLFTVLITLIDLEMEGVSSGSSLPFLVWLPPVTGLFLLLGVTGIYLDIAAEGGIPAGLNFLLVFSGTLAAMMVLFFGFASQATAGFNPTLIGSHTSGELPPPYVGNFFFVAGLLFIIGWPLFGFSCLRSGRYSRLASWLVMVGIPVGFPLRLPIPGGRAFGALIFGIGLAMIGWQLWRK